VVCAVSRNRRLRRLRHADGARGFVKTAAELAALGVADQGFQRRIFGKGLGRQRAGKRGGAGQPL